MRRVALKYCGGCDPTYDRVAYWGKIRNIAGERIEWVHMEDGSFDAILMIAGCQTACPERDLGSARDASLVVVRCCDQDPQSIVDILLA